MAEEQSRNQGNNQEQDLNQLLKVRREKLANLQEAGKDPFAITKYTVTHHTTEARDHFDELEIVPPKDEEGRNMEVPLSDIPEGKLISMAGRMMLKRVMGKASFANIRDLKGDMQIYVTRACEYEGTKFVDNFETISSV